MYILNTLLMLFLLLAYAPDVYAKLYKWVDENGQVHIEDKKVHTGCISGDCQNGIGTFFLPNGKRYKGEFKQKTMGSRLES